MLNFESDYIEEQGGFEKRKKKPRYDDEVQPERTRDKKRKKKDLDLEKRRQIKRGYLEE